MDNVSFWKGETDSWLFHGSSWSARSGSHGSRPGIPDFRGRSPGRRRKGWATLRRQPRRSGKTVVARGEWKTGWQKRPDAKSLRQRQLVKQARIWIPCAMDYDVYDARRTTVSAIEERRNSMSVKKVIIQFDWGHIGIDKTIELSLKALGSREEEIQAVFHLLSSNNLDVYNNKQAQ